MRGGREGGGVLYCVMIFLRCRKLRVCLVLEGVL